MNKTSLNSYFIYCTVLNARLETPYWSENNSKQKNLLFTICGLVKIDKKMSCIFAPRYGCSGAPQIKVN